MRRRDRLRLKLIDKKLSLVLLSLDEVTQELQSMSQVVDDLVAEVASLKTVVGSAEKLLTDLFALVQGAINTGDLAKVQATLDDVKAQKAELAASVAANTPPTPPGP